MSIPNYRSTGATSFTLWTPELKEGKGWVTLWKHTERAIGVAEERFKLSFLIKSPAGEPYLPPDAELSRAELIVLRNNINELLVGE